VGELVEYMKGRMNKRVTDREWVFEWKSERVVTRKSLWAKRWICGSVEGSECMNELVGEHVKWIAGDDVLEYLIGSISGGKHVYQSVWGNECVSVFSCKCWDK